MPGNFVKSRHTQAEKLVLTKTTVPTRPYQACASLKDQLPKVFIIIKGVFALIHYFFRYLHK